ncbi:DNA/RNA non-specific endonuclease [Tenacibaculum jejuense]|uniref:Putative endonuclease n=1 Tax=Tenacibaculum jejuense TaxID=584609 RepID=A0A238U7S1_9FLAO|nr:DNA/RNA non-specific endonuclease [Tenacibaculum jejuense]SNR14648.1 putative endonuclease [Tenacibaculum jejuense]
MKRKKDIFSVLLVIAVAIAYYYTEKREKHESTITEENDHVRDKSFDYLPSSTTGQIIHHSGYSFSYSEKHEQAEWVAYSLDKKDIIYADFKRPYFIQDPKVKTKSADWRNYKKSGYDKGHLCPAADRKSSKKLFNETFYTSNISPQKHNFNAGVWNRLEQKVRSWSKKYKHLYVITGGVLNHNSKKHIGKEKVTVPNAFYKVILDYKASKVKAIAFLIPHKETSQSLSDFVVSIDQLEKITGIDFFPKLPDALENKLEANNSFKNWSFR